MDKLKIIFVILFFENVPVFGAEVCSVANPSVDAVLASTGNAWQADVSGRWAVVLMIIRIDCPAECRASPEAPDGKLLRHGDRCDVTCAANRSIIPGQEPLFSLVC